MGKGYVPLESLPRHATLSQLFKANVLNAKVEAFKTDLYLGGAYGFFRVGRVLGNEVELGLIKFPYDSKECYGIIRDKVLRAGYTLAQRFYDKEWEFLFAPKEQAIA